MPKTEFVIVESVSNIEQTLQLSILFLQKFEHLTESERGIFSSLVHKLANPLVQINTNNENSEKQS